MSKFSFPDLPYDFNALEPYIDARTMEIHYTKHHKAYFDKFVAATDGNALADMELKEIFKDISNQSAAVRNNGGGFFNHTLFWNIMSANGGNPSGDIAQEINKMFGSFEAFQKEFNDAAANRFGSGWAWLIVNSDGKLEVCSTPNQDNPLMDVSDSKGTPILGLDVWEHAYYLKYQNRRPEYIDAFWNVVDWEAVNNNFKNAF
jgi:Fe-Mn family superoxide dismutase